MNYPRVALAAIVAWGVYMGVSFFVNNVILAPVYAENQALFRPQDQMPLGLGIGATLVGFFVFAYVFAKGYEGGRGIQEGLRFGVLIGLLLVCFWIVWTYVTMPVTGRLAVYWTVDALAEMALYGAIVGALYRPAANVRRA